MLLDEAPGITVNQANTTTGCTPFFQACGNGHAEVVSVLLDKARETIDVNQAETTRSGTPLFMACQHGHYEARVTRWCRCC